MDKSAKLLELSCQIVCAPCLPVVLSIAHGGDFVPPLTPKLVSRTQGITTEDKGVRGLVSEICAPRQLSLVSLFLPRVILDPNRSIDVMRGSLSRTQRQKDPPFADPRLDAVFHRYHKSVSALLRGAMSTFGSRATLFDLHTFGTQPPYAPTGGFDVILGTGNRRTISKGEPDRKLAGFLRQHGYVVFLPEAEPVFATGDWFSGGFGVLYQAETLQVNTVQVEVTETIACDEVRSKLLAALLAEFFAEHV
jgi:N-formylglutamate amidohydrolase